ncbi:ABC transporter substrate-binding protein [Dankookia sp. P2]|uniref:ABC transporter substrate-binding protein n=1 Tax=Dankookia sp. P2 TaxID=3423955 RepID=UPI003D66B46D
MYRLEAGGRAEGEGFTRAPIGTGPFALQGVTPNQSAELVAHQAYYRGKPQIAGISYRFIPSDASRDLAFQNKELDLNYGRADQTWINRVRQIPGVTVDIFEPAELTISQSQHHSAALHRYPRPSGDGARGQSGGAGALARPGCESRGQSPVPRGYLGFSGDNGLLGYDVAKAKALLAEAGYPNGLTIKAIHTQLPEMLNMMQVVQQQLRRAGITLDLQVVEHATFHQQIRQDLSPLVYYAAARFPVADIYLSQFFHGRSIVKTPTAVTNSHIATRPMRRSTRPGSALTGRSN